MFYKTIHSRINDSTVPIVVLRILPTDDTDPMVLSGSDEADSVDLVVCGVFEVGGLGLKVVGDGFWVVVVVVVVELAVLRGGVEGSGEAELNVVVPGKRKSDRLDWGMGGLNNSKAD